MPYTSTCIELQDEEIDAENQRSSQLSAQLMQRYRKNQGLNPCLPQFLFATAYSMLDKVFPTAII